MKNTENSPEVVLESTVLLGERRIENSTKHGITFRWDKEYESLKVRRKGETIACIDYAQQYNRWYWYALTGGPPHNTLLVKNSAIDEDGCKAEVISFFTT